jgi:hypothetical protein
METPRLRRPGGREVAMNRTGSSGRTSALRLSASFGAVLLLLSYGLLTGGMALGWSDRVDRENGYVWSTEVHAATSAYALVSDDIHLDTAGVQLVVDKMVDSVRLEVTPIDRTDLLFVGVARSADVRDYLRGVAYRQVGALGQGGTAWGWLGPGVTTNRPGTAPAAVPGDLGIWLSQSIGLGTRTVTWPVAEGDWLIVIMKADGRPGLSVTARTGAEAPHLDSIAIGIILVAICLLVAGARRVHGAMAGADVQPPIATTGTDEPEGPDDMGPAEDRAPVLVGR